MSSFFSRKFPLYAPDLIDPNGNPAACTTESGYFPRIDHLLQEHVFYLLRCFVRSDNVDLHHLTPSDLNPIQMHLLPGFQSVIDATAAIVPAKTSLFPSPNWQ
jgi:hypothetical protein